MSSITSKLSTFTGQMFTSGTLTVPTQALQQQNKYGFEINELALEAFINNLDLNTFFLLTEEEQNKHLEKTDVLDLFHAVENINRELAMLLLENHFLIDFMQKNDPKLLIGLEKHRVNPQSFQSNSTRMGKSSFASMAGAGGGSSVVSFRTKSLMSKSTRGSSSVNESQKKAYEYKLNFRAKAEMAEKLANEIEKRVEEKEQNATQEIKLLCGHMEEMRISQIETQETTKNFELHFLRDKQDLAFLNNATEKQLEHKFRKFVNNWIKNARALLASMRLKITALQEQCHHLRNELLTKTDLSGILTVIDFEKLIIKRTNLLNALDEKNIHMAGLKGVTSRAALSMAEEKKIMKNIEEESKSLNQQTIEVIRAITKLKKEAATVEKDNEKDISTLKSLRMQLDHFEAPSINEYIENKNELMMLEKEEKMLRRKMYLLNMKLDNNQRKCKPKTDSSIFINIID